MASKRKEEDEIDNMVILQHIANGYTSEEIGEKMFRGKDCIDKRRGDIVVDLGARNITHAVAIALRTNLID